MQIPALGRFTTYTPTPSPVSCLMASLCLEMGGGEGGRACMLAQVVSGSRTVQGV